jgi:hypothetical protein
VTALPRRGIYKTFIGASLGGDTIRAQRKARIARPPLSGAPQVNWMCAKSSRLARAPALPANSQLTFTFDLTVAQAGDLADYSAGFQDSMARKQLW